MAEEPRVGFSTSQETAWYDADPSSPELEAFESDKTAKRRRRIIIGAALSAFVIGIVLVAFMLPATKVPAPPIAAISTSVNPAGPAPTPVAAPAPAPIPSPE